MSGLRGSQNVLRILARRSLFIQNLRADQDTLRTRFSTLSLSRLSTAKVKETVSHDHQHSSQNESSNADPFGLGDIVESEEKSSVLVQGFYPKQEKDSVSEVMKQAPSLPPVQSDDVDPQKQRRLSKYDDWLKQRDEMINAERHALGESESLRPAHFGRVRVDADNFPPRSRLPLPDDKDFKIGGNSHEKFRMERARLKESRQVPSSEPIIERIEADHSKRMRASEFYEQLEQKYSKSDQSSDEGNQEESTKETVIEKIIWPRNQPSMDPNDPRNYESAKANPIILDSNVVPKEYKLPEYNQLTEGDMWNILRKTIIFQNDFIFAINKPPGVPVHSKTRDCRHTILRFMNKFAELAECKEVFPLHRIDKETTGVLLFAKDQKVATILKEKFAKREISKTYLGVTKLCPRIREGTINIPIGEGKIPGTTKYRRVLRPDLREYGINPSNKHCVQAITKYKVLHSIEEAAFVEIEPVTGYKHQIRVHFGMGLGCPIVGDHKYSHRDRLAPQRLHPFVCHKLKIKQTKVRELPLHLHCNSIKFTLPEEFTNSTEPVYIHAKIPFYMRYTLRRLGLIR